MNYCDCTDETTAALEVGRAVVDGGGVWPVDDDEPESPRHPVHRPHCIWDTLDADEDWREQMVRY